MASLLKKNNTKKIERIQERSLRILYNDFTSSYASLLEKADTTTVLIRRLRLIAIFVFKSLHGLNPSYCKDMFNFQTHMYNFRNTYTLVQPARRTTTFGLKTISYIGAKLWNCLPNWQENCMILMSLKMLLHVDKVPMIVNFMINIFKM